MKSIIVFILSLFFISAVSSQSFNKIPGKQDFTDSIKFSKFLNSVGEDSVLTIDRVTKKLKFVLKGGGSSGGVDSCTSASNGFYYWKSGTPTLVITPNNVYSFILNYDSTYQLIYKNSVLEDSISLGVKSLYPEIGSSITIRGNGDSVFIGDGGSGVGYVPYTGATSSPNLGEFGISEGFSQYDTTVTTYTRNTGNIGWNDTDGTLEFNLKGNSVSLQIGQETVLRVVNKTGSNLLESQYLAVYVSGAQGQRVKVNLASANADSMSAKTIGVVTENINVNQEGFITTSGLVREINTTGSLQSETWVDGDILYLSPTINGGLTNIKPTAPQHTVLMGYCVYAHAIHGSIFVKVVDGFKLDDLHNVKITTPLNNEALVYETATKLWKNKAPIDATKLNISDTALMLLPYRNKINLNTDSIISIHNQIVGLSSGLALKENSLGNPSTNGYVLSSTTAGIRSWVAQGGSGDDSVIRRNDSLISIKNGVERNVFVQEKSLGTIYKATTWSDLSAFTNSGSTSSVVSNKINFSAGANTFTQFLKYNYESGLEQFIYTIGVKVTEKSATSYGFGIGHSGYTSNLIAKFDASTGSNSGRILLYGAGDNHLYTSSASSIAFSANDSVVLTVERNKDIAIVTAYNYTTKTAPISITYKFSFLISSTDRVPNEGTPSIYSFGGTFTVYEMKVYSNALKYATALAAGDSKTAGYDAGYLNARYASILTRIYPSLQVNAGSSEGTAQLLLKLPEIISLFPRQVLLNIGRNDIGLGIPSAIYLPNYDTISVRLERAGIRVVHLLPFPETTTGGGLSPTAQDTLKNHIVATYPEAQVIDTYTPLKGITDGIHPNLSQNEIIANTIINSGKVYGNNAIGQIGSNEIAYGGWNGLIKSQAKLSFNDSINLFTVIGTAKTDSINNLGNISTAKLLASTYVISDTIYGGSGASENLTLLSNGTATKGKILFAGAGVVNETTGNFGFGITSAPSYLVTVSRTTNGAERIGVSNPSAGTAAQALIQVDNGTNGFQMGTYSTGFTTSGLRVAASSYFQNTAPNGLIISSNSSSGTANIRLTTSDGTTETEHWRIRQGTGSLSNTAANGTAYIHLKAGTATASTAPIKLTAGTSLTTPEAGAVEFDGTNYWVTTTGAGRVLLVRTITGTAAPATPPAAVGMQFVDTVNKKLYVATGTSSSADWTILN